MVGVVLHDGRGTLVRSVAAAGVVLAGADVRQANVQLFLWEGEGLAFLPNPDRPPAVVVHREE